MFCQGSLPNPLIERRKDQSLHLFGGGIVNFDFLKWHEKYHIVFITKPITPVVVVHNEIDSRYCYVKDTANAMQFWREYGNHDFIENYVDRGTRVLDYLKKQEWVDASRIV
ncbi:hypothetical protein AUTU_12020 [Aureibacter tunicatorum]|nr:hypothetical protein AUTU_12020 [Aureibacter tunicatorum]